MDKKIAGLIGAVSALVSLDAAHAATTSSINDVMTARSYADLLAPIPNALPLLKASDSVKQATQVEAPVAPTQVAYDDHHHHHYVKPRYHHHRYHHHHHHHHSAY